MCVVATECRTAANTHKATGEGMFYYFASNKLMSPPMARLVAFTRHSPVRWAINPMIAIMAIAGMMLMGIYYILCVSFVSRCIVQYFRPWHYIEPNSINLLVIESYSIFVRG
jgi:hypothetical protein